MSGDIGEARAKRLLARRKHKRQWPQPDAYLVLDVHTSVQCFRPHQHHAEISLEIPVPGGFEYFSVSATKKTRRLALRTVIERVETSQWFHQMRERGVRFKVTGCLEKVYRGYL